MISVFSVPGHIEIIMPNLRTLPARHINSAKDSERRETRTVWKPLNTHFLTEHIQEKAFRVCYST